MLLAIFGGHVLATTGVSWRYVCVCVCENAEVIVRGIVASMVCVSQATFPADGRIPGQYSR